jgi:K+-sensing histidine kinase KdpD
VAIEADPQILAAVVGNLLQNAFKFTRPHSTVRLLIDASVDRVFIEVHDECGGLPGGDVDELFPRSSSEAVIEPGWALG